MARKYAAVHRPSSDATEPDDFEQKIALTAKRQFGNEKQPIIEDAELIAERLGKARQDLQVAVGDVEKLQPVARVAEFLKDRLQREREPHADVLVQEYDAEVEVNDFKYENELNRSAHDDKKFLELATLVLVFLVLETLCNAYFYRGFEGGYIGGAVIAFSISFVVAALGLLTGFFFRYKNHKGSWQRLGGWLSIVVGSLMAVYISSATALYRSLVEVRKSSDPLTLFDEAWRGASQVFLLRETPFHDIYAALLFVFALLAFINAVNTGYKSLDPVPDYSRVARKQRNLINKRLKDVRRIRDDVEHEGTDMVNKREGLVSQIADADRTHSHLSLRLDECEQRFKQLAQDVNHDFRDAVTLYRSTNSLIRAADVPAYFKVQVDDLKFEEPLLFAAVRGNLAKFQGEISAQRDLLKTLSQEIRQIREVIATLQDSIEKFQQRCQALAKEVLARRRPRRLGAPAG